MQNTLRRDLVRFAVLTAIITGGLWLLLVASGLDIREGAGFWIFGVATSGPSLAALFLPSEAAAVSMLEFAVTVALAAGALAVWGGFRASTTEEEPRVAQGWPRVAERPRT